MEIFLLGLFWSAAAFFLFGQIVAVRISFLNKFSFSFFEHLWFYLFIGICYVLFLGAKITLLVATLGLLLDKLLGFSELTISLVYLGAVLVFLTYFFAKWYITKKEIPSTAISFIPVFILIYFKNSISLSLIDSLGLVWLGLVILIGLMAATIRVLLLRKDIERKVKPVQAKALKLSPVNKKLVFIGVDGCDWKLFNDFLSQGKLPNFKKLIDSGVLAKNRTIQPTLSPLIWNSILSGKAPSEHGVTFWYKTKFPFLSSIAKELRYPANSSSGKVLKKLLKYKIAKRVPFSANDRKVKAIWNILTDCNKTSLNLGWLYSWPAETINGVQVSWYMYPFEEAAEDNFKRLNSTKLKQRVYPENLTAELKQFIVRSKDLTKQDLASMYFPTEAIDPQKQFAHKLSFWDYAKDKSFLEMSHYLLKHQKDWDFFSLYLYGLDAVCHSYWPFFSQATNNQKYKAEILSVSESEQFKQEAKNFSKTIERYYQYLDQEIGKLLARFGDQCNIVIASDHGFDFNGSVHDQAPDGLFIASGPYIKELAEARDVTIYDILPTLLTLLGLPQAKDMPGEAAREIFSDEFLTEVRLGFIDSYENEFRQPKPSNMNLDEATRAGIEQRLKSLGYID